MTAFPENVALTSARFRGQTELGYWIRSLLKDVFRSTYRPAGSLTLSVRDYAE